jgi:hypothetical protein
MTCDLLKTERRISFAGSFRADALMAMRCLAETGRLSDIAGELTSRRLGRRLAMSSVWAWIFGIVIALCILGLMAYGRSERRAYWAARGAIVHQPQAATQPLDRTLYGHLSR